MLEGGSRKLYGFAAGTATRFQPGDLGDFVEDPLRLFSGPARAVCASDDRRPVERPEFVRAHFDIGGRPDGHGFTKKNLDSGEAYYVYDANAGIRIIVLGTTNPAGHYEGSIDEDQLAWLEADLQASQHQPWRIALFHRPPYSAGSRHGSDLAVRQAFHPLFEQYDVQFVIVGHEHNYERFAPQNPAGQPDAARGLRQFVVGTGGRSHYGFGTPLPTSEVRDATAYGVLKLTLGADSYTWQFIPVAGQSFTDAGTSACH